MEDKTPQRKIMILIPCYKEESAIRNVASQAIQVGLGDVIVIDDGSHDKTADEARIAGAHVIIHEKNMGKGAAMVTGFTHAIKNNYDAVITLDGDATQLCEAFEGDETLLTVTLPDSITSLGGYSFSGCPNLTTINFGNGITTVESNAIYDCPSLSEFSGSIVSDDGYCLVVGGTLFYMLPIDESVTSYSIPNGVQSFNFGNVGSSPNVTEVSFPDSLTTLNGFGSFYKSFSNVKKYTGKFASADGYCLIESGDLCYFAPQALTGLTSYSVPNGVTIPGGLKSRTVSGDSPLN